MQFMLWKWKRDSKMINWTAASSTDLDDHYVQVSLNQH